MPDEDAIKFNCPHCGQSVESSPKNAGMTVDCPACGKPFQVPGAKPQPPVQKNWSALQWIVPFTSLILLLWWYRECWKSKGAEFTEGGVLQIMLIAPFLFWTCIAWVFTPPTEHGRFLAVLSCGIMAVAWWGLHSIPCLIVGGVILLFGLTKIITSAMQKRN
jgi:endogenous inhibitor of DNA gyrase (YacG/DUF329 family)